ncbi:dihydrodipicolinate synthase family protein [Planctomicrobium piriforme]|uniref:4-hydroxy-tetrahydrodipicolinate synthase n=1 Tax=Planctomicrobium piriforme TaxID=1576369 RepID=A0A1I3QVG3_9PLAN|nr:dihydrodipicolinate synthase family protein [Planctomicrobium piriforme]SFJ37740.1 4-hydroxy-tetrahydrodipicolinate synthase [Planctomicrobium piriforme]
MKSPLSGIIPPLLTPLTARDQLDVAGLERLIEHVLAGGVHGLFLLGTTGEAPSLSYRLRRELVTKSCRIVNGRVPVLVGITDTSFVEAVRFAEHASDCGADAVVAAPPYYLPPSQPELREFILELMTELPLPLMLYNMPGLTQAPFELPTVAALMQHDGILGIKDSSGDMKYVQGLLQLARQRSDWSVLIGPEELTAEGVLMGAHGGVSGGANLSPKLFVDLYTAAAAGDVPRVRKLQRKALQLSELLYSWGQTRGGWILGLKCALSHLGICSDLPAEPLRSLTDAERETIRERLAVLGLLPVSPSEVGVNE